MLKFERKNINYCVGLLIQLIDLFFFFFNAVEMETNIFDLEKVRTVGNIFEGYMLAY